MADSDAVALRRTHEARSLERAEADALVESVENEILTESLGQIQAAINYADVEGMQEPPAEWVQALGKARARRRFRAAQAGAGSLQDMPVGLRLAQALTHDLMRACRDQPPAPRTLNLTYVNNESPATTLAKYKQTVVEEKHGKY